MFICARKEASQSTSTTRVSSLDELQLWCKVAGINKGKVYGLGCNWETILLGFYIFICAGHEGGD